MEFEVLLHLKFGEKSLCYLKRSADTIPKEYIVNIGAKKINMHSWKTSKKFSKLQNQLPFQRTLFNKSSVENESLTKDSHKGVEVLAESDKPLEDGE
ncbi:hypothetical protein TNCT_645961 [Trichonephila clavata]|uniref:Uncharacterized protein n=1 Tax=Trichonephila clavata TaxID=2740835 RepID=A0A8X6HGP7_TRICU|nr:hypothetical protein TNCT_645961 [Trichonephila clavata]